MPDRILLLSYAFPPTAAPEAFLAAKRMGSVEGFEVDVITLPPEETWWPADASLETYVKQRFGSVTRVRRSSWMRHVRAGRFAPLAHPPDHYRLLNGPMRRAAARALASGRYAAFVTWSQMHSVHLVGPSLRRRFGVPWLAHFSDPWLTNPFRPLEGLERRLNERLERRVFVTADRLLFTSPQAVELCTSGYTASVRAKARSLPHAYDPSIYPARARPVRRELVVRYLGAFYHLRTPRPILDALAVLRASDPELARRIRVEIVGAVAPELLPQEGSGVSVRAPVSYFESLRLMVDADALLVVDAPGSSSPFLPSKLVDYVGAGRPIAAFTPDGPAADLTRRLGGPVADPTDPGACADALRRVCALAEEPDAAPFGDPWVRRELAAAHVGAEMAAVVREAAGGASDE